MQTNSIGTNADTKAGVDISKVHGGYFADPVNLKKFIELGIDPIINSFSKDINYVDFGGGQGHLASAVKKYLEDEGYMGNAIVADANDGYLLKAKERGLETKLCNLEDKNFSNLDLATMRAVLHYNTPTNQKLILESIFKSLKNGGYLVHQNSSGNKENCELRSALVNIQELGRAGAGNYHWVSEEEYLLLVREVGFSNTVTNGYAKANSWGPEEQWDRFNSEITRQAVEGNNKKALSDIEIRKKAYLAKAYKMIKEYSDKYGKEYLGIKDIDNGKLVIEYLYPIIVSKK